MNVWNEHGLGISPHESVTPRGQIGGFPYEYVLGRTRRGSGFRIIATKVRAVWRLQRLIRQAHAAGAVDLIWFNQLSLYDTWPLTVLAKRLGIRTVQAYEDERRTIVSTNKQSWSARLFALNSYLSDRWCPQLADAIVVISSYLEEKYWKRASATQGVYRIPTAINCAEWACSEEETPGILTLLYSGAFGEQDEIENLVEALSMLRDAGHSFEATLVGTNGREPARIAAIKQQIRRSGLSDLIDMPGFLPQSDLRSRVCDSNLLVAIRRDATWSRSGLSTKLSEYLASGRAVVVSDVGESRCYLEEGKNAYVVPATATPKQILAALERAISSDEQRRLIGLAGQEVAREHFDVRVVGGLLQEMLSAVDATTRLGELPDQSHPDRSRQPGRENLDGR